MAETKFTSGPWYPGHLGDPDTTCECRYICNEDYAGGIAEVYVHNGIDSPGAGGNDCPPREQAVGNMHLIAASPELYEVLKAITDCYGVGSAPEKFVEHVHDFMMRGRALLAKARGENPTTP